MRIWECKIGEVDSADLPKAADGPMQSAVRKAYQELTGREPTFTFTGWGGSLTESERAVVEDREPDPSLFVLPVEPVLRGEGDGRMRALMHRCGNVKWFTDPQVRMGVGGCGKCGSTGGLLDWSQLYQPQAR